MEIKTRMNRTAPSELLAEALSHPAVEISSYCDPRTQRQ